MAAIGVLAVQGAFARHASVIESLGHRAVLVRAAADIAGIEGLVLPGGESTVQLDLVSRFALERPIRDLVARGRPTLATCAGLILVAREVRTPKQRSFGAIDVAVARNAWGRQVDSFEGWSDPPDAPEDADGIGGGAAGPLPLVFIRAPRIEAVGDGVEVLARLRGEPVLVRQRNVIGATFHPELTSDRRVHALAFASLRASTRQSSRQNLTDEPQPQLPVT